MWKVRAWLTKVQDSNMKRLTGFKFYELGLKLQPIDEIKADTTYKERFYELWFARKAVTEMLTEFPELTICRNAATELVQAINDIVPQDWPTATKQDMEAKFDYKHYAIRSGKEKFENVLSAELSSLDTYLLTQQGIYNTAYLVEKSEMSFSEDTRAIISAEAKKDFRQGGRCLAFELPTASGYHTLRATESVLRQYHCLVMALPGGSKSPEMAQCINELKKKGEDAKVLSILDSIRDLHRNPQMHPDVFLSMDEAAALFDITKSAINTMAMRIDYLTKSPVTAQLPLIAVAAPVPTVAVTATTAP